MNAPAGTRFYVLFIDASSKRAEVLSRAGYATAGEGRRAWSVCSHGAMLVRADGSLVDERTGTSKTAKLMLRRLAGELARELAASPLPVFEQAAAIEIPAAAVLDADPDEKGPSGAYVVTSAGDAEAPLVLTRQPEAEPVLAKTSKRLRARAPVAPVETVIELPAAPAPAEAAVEAPVEEPLEPLVPACEHTWAHAGLGAACVLCGERVRYGESRWPAVEAALREAAALERAAAPVVTAAPAVTSAPAEPEETPAEPVVTPEAAEPVTAPETPAGEELAEGVARVIERERHEAFAESQRELADVDAPGVPLEAGEGIAVDEGLIEAIAPVSEAVAASVSAPKPAAPTGAARAAKLRSPGVAKALSRPAKPTPEADPAEELDAALSLVRRQARVIEQLGGLEAAEEIAAGVARGRRAGGAR